MTDQSPRLARLSALARAATVHLLPAEGDATPLWGSGFLIAPGWVLTAAHVLRPHLAKDRSVVFRVRGDGVDCAARLESWLITEPARPVVPPEEDLALVRLADDTVEHECVWLTDRAERHSGALKAYGYRPDPPEGARRRAVAWNADAEINGHDDDAYGLVFKPDNDFPGGVSGGPLLDPDTGAVVGLIKSRRMQRDGGKAVSLGALRSFGDTYRTVMAAHDAWHGGEPVSGDGDNWVDLQSPAAGRGEYWTPEDRRSALALLAELPPPPDTPTVELLAGLARSRHKWPGGTPELLTWRDGCGLLYEGTHALSPFAFLRYLTLVAEYVSCRGGDTRALRTWTAKRLRRHPSRDLYALVEEVRLPDELRPRPEDGPGRVVIRYPGPGEGPVVTVLLDPVIGSNPTHFFWQIWVDGGHGTDDGKEPELYATDRSLHGSLPGELVQSLRTPLGRLFKLKDADRRPVPLEVALPAEYFDTPVHKWRFDDIAELDDTGHLGARRGLVLRALARRGEPDKLWVDRWQAMASEQRFSAWRTPERGVSQNALRYQEAACGLIPVMCRPAGSGTGRVAMKLALESGHGVALWHVDGHASRACPDACDVLYVKVEELFGTLDSLAELPDRVRHVRQEISERHPDRRWAKPLALLYDDPRRPLPAEETEPVDSPL
ncbi:trypsin-like peptidase domain-containing protein [Streptomyces sp. NPDC005485]|uniref:VMAP-C domain-containing protein n=1 Tax=Streptomyces sp. NPDC005485 TaxID=3155591 RepID=UPI00339EAE5D